MAASNSAADTPADQAYQVFRSHLQTLIKEIVPDLSLCDGLFSALIIGEDEYEFVMDDKKKVEDKARKLLFKALQSMRSKYQNFEKFCDLLQKSDLPVNRNWAIKLKEEVQSNKKENDSFKVLSSQLSVIKSGLLQSDENIDSKVDIMKEFIRNFIINSLDAGVLYEELLRQLNVLCYRDMSVHASLVDWTFEELKCLHAKSNLDEKKIHSMVPLNPPAFSVQSELFSKEHINACLLLCKTVASYDRSNYESFLTGQAHEFDEVSFSHSTDEEKKLDPYIIAKVETRSEIYVAFLGEPRFNVWQEKYHTFSEGISLQVSLIPIRFFIEQIRNGYKIFLTGFSMGGLLALSIYASLWKDTCLSIQTLLQSVVCISFGCPLIPLEEIETAFKSVPNMKENSHIYIMENDIIPRLLQFLEVRPNKKGEFNAGELIFNQLAVFAHKKAVSGIDAVIDISDLKKILQEKQLSMSVETKIFGKCQYIYMDSLNVKISVLAAGAVSERLKVPDVSELEQIAKERDIMIQHTLAIYESSLSKCLHLSAEAGKSTVFKDMSILKPELSSITFYRHGDEIALVLQGENLWFCSKIEITSKGDSPRVINTVGADATSRSIYFNYVPKDENDLIIKKRGEIVEVVCYSHFAKLIRKKLSVECKGEYRATFRQRQVAKLTPQQVILISFLSSILEVMEKNYSSSSRYKAIRRFLEEAVRIVPLESIFCAIAAPDQSDENAWKCATAFASTNLKIPPSLLLSQSLGSAFARLIGLTPTVWQNIQQQAIFHHLSATSGPFPSPIDISVNVNDENINVSIHPVSGNIDSGISAPPSSSFTIPQTFHQPIENKIIIDSLQRCKIQVDNLIRRRHPPRVLCGTNIDVLYSTKIQSSSKKSLPSPITVIRKGREELQELQEAKEDITQILLVEKEDKKEFGNEKMISTLNRIFTNDLSLCAYVLGAFMQQQITVPLIDSSSESDTAHILQTTECPSAVGVWALFCLKMIDFERMTRAKKSKALLVKVEKYIKGLFAKGSGDPHHELFRPEQFYAGKLQFLLQCFISSVSCNTNYISYSLERQLADLCTKCDITPTTRVQALIKNWNTYFKNNLLLYVMEQFRPVVARWILWCLSIHHLREELASHTTVGIIGLSNSGKSCLVKSLFKQKINSGTTTFQRTTVPFLYNLEGLVNGLDVIDFPGMDDKDENVVKISNILLQISQLVILVVEYKRYNTKPVSVWVKALKDAGVPVLICLTHADKLYASMCLDENGDPKYTNDEARRLMNSQLEEICKNLEQPPSWKVDLFTFSLDSDSKLNTAEGIKCLEEVDISFSIDVGRWIENELRNYMKQSDIADNLNKFLLKMARPKPFEDSHLPPPVRGLDIIDETNFDVTQDNCNFTWEGYGLRLTFPRGAIKNTSQLLVKVISSGHYEIPDGTKLVSSLYWLYFPEKLKKPVDIEIEHCFLPALSEQGSLTFIKGQCDQDLPYKFNKRPNGSFSRHHKRGLLSLQSFCILGVVCSLRTQIPDSSQPLFWPIACVAKVFSKCEANGKSFEIVFIKNLESFHTVIDTKYQQNGWSLYNNHSFEFGSETLLVNVAENADLKGWHYVDKYPGKVIEHESIMDCFCPKSCTDNCCLQFEWPKKTFPNNVICPIKVTMADGKEITLSLPLAVDFSTEFSVKKRMQEVEQDNFDSGHGELKANDAMLVLKDAEFSFANSYQDMMTRLNLNTDEKRRLLSELKSSGHNFEMLVEEAIDWWISNGENPSWNRLVSIVDKIDKKATSKMKEILTSKFLDKK